MDLFGDTIEEEREEEESLEEIAPAESQSGLKPPRAADICLGHEAQEKDFLDLIAAGRLPHGLIFAGPKGIGKATLAYRLARYLLKNGIADPNQDSLFDDAPATPESLHVDPADPVFRRVASGGHPDLFNIERAYDAAKNRYKAGVEVEEVRKVAPFLRMTASGGGWRVVIIDDADTMNRNAQNAILKILEEPPKNAVLILVAHRPGALIPTIRSRARTITFQPLAPDLMTELLNRAGADFGPTRTQTLIRMAGGSIGHALELLEEEGLETLDRVLAAFETYPQWNWANLHIMADDLGRFGQDRAYKSFAEILQWVFAQLATAKARGLALPLDTPGAEALEHMTRNSSLEQLLKICENLQGHFDRAEYANLDKRQAVLGAFSLIAA